MGLSWQQGPLAPGAIGRFLVPDPLPERMLFAEPLRRRMRVQFGGAWIADSEDVVLLHEPGRYPVAYERIVGHAADSYHRIDIRQTRRHLVVHSGDQVAADSTRPLVLYESGFAPRWYVPRDDADLSVLTPVAGQTFCPYKGLASYFDIGGAHMAAWSYQDAWTEVRRVSGHISFEPDKVAVTLDGKQLQLEPGQAVIPHGIDRDLTTDEVAASKPS
jgi:uncharacterized protein (DUF427 family)